jgi:glutaconate CoA-transferase subunit B
MLGAWTTASACSQATMFLAEESRKMISEGNQKHLLNKYTPMEFACSVASKYCADGTNVVVGVGLSLLPAQMAQKSFAPNITVIYEGGSIGATPVGRVPWCIDDTVIQANAECQTDLLSALGWLAQSGRVDLTFLGAAQIDKFGNINSTLYGRNFARPAARVSGSGGAHDLAIGSKKFVVIMNHKPDRIVEKLDYRTSPGFCEGGRTRWDVWGLPGGGPAAIVTDLAVLKPNLVSYEMEIAEIYPFTSVEEVVKNTGYPIKLSPEWTWTDLPSEIEVRMIREELDTTGDFTGWTKLPKADERLLAEKEA